MSLLPVKMVSKIAIFAILSLIKCQIKKYKINSKNINASYAPFLALFANPFTLIKGQIKTSCNALRKFIIQISAKIDTRKVAVLFLILSALSSPAYSEDTQLFEASNTPIADFVAWGSRQLGKPIVLGSGVSGSVTFSAPSLSPDEYPSFFNSVLRSHGYEVNYQDNVYVVSPRSDVVTTIEPPIVKLYRLNHVRNAKIVPLLTSTLLATKAQSVNNIPIDNVSVEILPTSNALIVAGTDEQLTQIDALIAGIDRPQRQVFIEAIITETAFDDNQEIGVNMESAFKKAGFITNTVIPDVATDNLVIFESGDFSALIKAVTTNERTKLLSRPNMLIMDRERGYITVGQNVPFITSNEVTDGGNTIQQIERQDVGVSLEVTPHVIGNDIVLTIAQESQSVTNSTIAADIITNKRTLQTVVKVGNQQTIALGGLISNDERKRESGVPVLKDIPLVGALFRSQREEVVQTELKIVIRTTIL